MRRFVLTAALVAAAFGAKAQTISSLPAATSANLTDLLPCTQLGSPNVTRKCTGQQIVSLAAANILPLSSTQIGAGASLPTLFGLSRTEPTAPGAQDSPVSQYDYTVNWGGGTFAGYNNVQVNTTVSGDASANGPAGNVYPFASSLYESALRSTLSPPTGSQDANVYSFVQKTLPSGGVPAGRVMRDTWNWWAQLYGANVPSSQGGSDVMWEHDVALNGLDDANKQAVEQTIYTLHTSLSDGGYPASVNVARYLSGGDNDFWAHDWQEIGGNFSHAALSLWFASSGAATIQTASANRYSVTVDNIMPLEAGGSSGGVPFPTSSTAAIQKTQVGVASGHTITLADTNYIAANMWVYDVTNPSAIADGTAVSSVSGNVLTLTNIPTSANGDALIFARGRGTGVKVGSGFYTVAGVMLAGAGSHAGTVYFTGPLSTGDATPGNLIYPNAHSIWLCSGSATAPWCDISFDASGTNTLRGDGAGGAIFTGANLTAHDLLAPAGLNLLLGAAASSPIPTTSTNGFPQIPYSNGAPTGVAPIGSMQADTLNQKLCVSLGSGVWHCI